MDDIRDFEGMQLVYDRLTRLEARGEARDDRMARLEETIRKMSEKLDLMADDVKSAKTGLRVGLWISTTVLPVVSGSVGWFAHHLLGK